MIARLAVGVTITAVTLTTAIGSARGADTIRWLNDWLPSGDKAAIYYGVQKGIFATERIEIEIASARGSSDVVTRLAAGSADVGTGGLSALLQARAETHIGVTAVMSIYTNQPDALFTYAGSGISALSDIVGKTVATATFSSSNVIWPLILQANGIDPRAVTLLKIDPGALAPMLATGRIAATINWVTVAPGFDRTIREAGKTLKIMPWSEYGYQGYGLSLFLADKFVKEKPDLARRFVTTYRKVLAAAIADPKGAAAALKTMVPEVDEPTVEKEWIASIPLMANEVSRTDGIGSFEQVLLTKTWEWVARSLNVPVNKLDPETVIDRSFLTQ